MAEEFGLGFFKAGVNPLDGLLFGRHIKITTPVCLVILFILLILVCVHWLISCGSLVDRWLIGCLGRLEIIPVLNGNNTEFSVFLLIDHRRIFQKLQSALDG